MTCNETTEGIRAPGWYTDPFGRAEVRCHDGQAWSDQVASHGRQATDMPGGTPKAPTVNRRSEKVRRDVANAGVNAMAAGGGTLFTGPVLVVNQKAKMIEMHNEFAASLAPWSATRSTSTSRRRLQR